MNNIEARDRREGAREGADDDGVRGETKGTKKEEDGESGGGRRTKEKVEAGRQRRREGRER